MKDDWDKSPEPINRTAEEGERFFKHVPLEHSSTFTGPQGITPKKRLIFIDIVMKASNLCSYFLLLKG
jgi:hypothetical protein